MTDVKMPDGTIIRNVPDGITKGELQRRMSASNGPSGNKVLRAGEFAARGFSDRALEVIGSVPELASSGLRAIHEDLAPRPGFYPDNLKKGFNAVGEFISSPLNAISDFGPAEPQSAVERWAYGGGGGLADAAAFMVPGMAAAKYGGPVLQGVGRAMTTQPAMQVASAVAGGGVSEATGSDALGLAAALAVPLSPVAARKALTPFASQLSGNEKKLASAAQKIGIKLTPGQATGSKPLRTMESVFTQTPFTGAKQGQIYSGQRSAFNKAVMKTAGIDADSASPEVIDDAFKSLGKRFDELAAATTIKVDKTFVDDIARVQGEYGRRLPTDIAPVFKSYMDDLSALGQQLANKPEIAGREYQALSSSIKRRARSASNNPDLQESLYALARSIDDNLERSAGPALKAAWRDVRSKYRNLLTIDKAVGGGTQASRASADVPFAGLRQAVKASDKTGYGRGRGDLNELSRVGDFLGSAIPPDSGTSSRGMMKYLLSGGGGGGAGYLLAGGNPVVALGAAGAALGGPKVAQTIYNTPLMQRYLMNQLRPSGPLSKQLLGNVTAAQQLGNLVD